MSNLTALLDLALDIAVAYHETRRPRKPILAADAVLLLLAGIMALTALGFALAAAFLAMAPATGTALAALFTALIALGIGLAAFTASRLLMSDAT